jgi:hypothetical protein
MVVSSDSLADMNALPYAAVRTEGSKVYTLPPALFSKMRPEPLDIESQYESATPNAR